MPSTYWDVDACGWVACSTPTAAAVGVPPTQPAEPGSEDDRPAQPPP